jgi:hypothetical protein
MLEHVRNATKRESNSDALAPIEVPYAALRAASPPPRT